LHIYRYLSNLIFCFQLASLYKAFYTEKAKYIDALRPSRAPSSSSSSSNYSSRNVPDQECLVNLDDNSIDITEGNSNSYYRYPNDTKGFDSTRAAQPSIIQNVFSGFMNVVNGFRGSSASDTSQTSSSRRIHEDKDGLLQILNTDNSRIMNDFSSSSNSSNPSRMTKTLDQAERSDGEAELEFSVDRSTNKAQSVGLAGIHTRFNGSESANNRAENVIIIDSDDETGTRHEDSPPASAAKESSVLNTNTNSSNTNNTNNNNSNNDNTNIAVDEYETIIDEETQLVEPVSEVAGFKEDSISYLDTSSSRGNININGNNNNYNNNSIYNNNNNNNNNSNNYSSYNNNNMYDKVHNNPRSEESSRDGSSMVQVIDINMSITPTKRRHSQLEDNSSEDEVEVIKTVTRKQNQNQYPDRGARVGIHTTQCSLQLSNGSITKYPEPDESRDSLRRNGSTNSATKRSIERYLEEEDDENDRYNNTAKPAKKKKSLTKLQKEHDDEFIDNSGIYGSEEEEGGQDEGQEDSEYSDSDRPHRKKEKTSKKSSSSSSSSKKKTGQHKKTRVPSPDPPPQTNSTVDLTDF
jgi:hypothetical protein